MSTQSPPSEYCSWIRKANQATQKQVRAPWTQHEQSLSYETEAALGSGHRNRTEMTTDSAEVRQTPGRGYSLADDEPYPARLRTIPLRDSSRHNANATLEVGVASCGRLEHQQRGEWSMCTHLANTISEVQYEHAPGIATTMWDIGSRGACYFDRDADQNMGARYLRCRLVTAGWPPHRTEHLIGIPKEVHKRRLRQGSFESGSPICGNTIRTLEQHTTLANILQRQTEFQKPTAEERATV